MNKQIDNVIPIDSNHKKYEVCSLWLAKMDRTLTSDEELRFKEWLKEDKSHQPMLFKMAALWDKMSELKRLSKLFPEPSELERSSKGNRITHWPMNLAASVLLVLFVGIVSMGDSFKSLTNSNRLVYSITYETQIGENRIIYLPDNTKISLNTDSQVSVEYYEDYRVLKLKRGELHVQVAHDKSRPLSVLANNKVIQAVGTAFNVQKNHFDIELIVTEGKVIIGQFDPLQPFEEDVLNISSDAIAVTKGEYISLGLVKNKPQKIDSRTLSDNLSWQKGNLVFNGETLEEALKEVSRYTSVKFIIRGDDLKNIKIAGRFKTGDIDGLIRALSGNFNIKTERVGDESIVLSQN